MSNIPIPDVPFVPAPGWTPSAQRHAVKAGGLDRLQPGVFAAVQPRDQPSYSYARAMNLRQARAACLKCDRGVISQASATISHDLPVVGKAVKQSCLTVESGTALRRLAKVHLHRATIDEILMVAGFPTTSVARSVMDLAREHGVVAGLAAADAALHNNLVTHEQLQAVLAMQERWPGVRRAQFVADFADDRTESPLESVSRLRIHERGLPPPETQVLICDEHGMIVTRCDFYWNEFGVIGEADGAMKWTNDPGAREAQEEKTHLLEGLGLIVVRWGWADTGTFGGVARRLCLGYERGARPGSPLRRWGVVRTAPRA